MAGQAILAAEPAPAPLPPDDAFEAMRVPEGFNVTLVAAEPDVVQPIAFSIDDRGRLFVAEALNYGAWQPEGNDRIVILDDTDGDGRCDSRTLFYEGFNYVTGIEVGFGGVWVMSPPNLYFVADRDRDDMPDAAPEVLFDGFGYTESRHNLANGFTWGPDGWLYAGHGRTSPSDVGRPGTPVDQRVHCDGGVYRIHPTRLVFENFADGTTNPWGVDFDDFGQCFVSNCVNPHLFHMIQGGHYEPWRNRPSSLYAYERLPTCADHLHYPGGKPSAMRGETQETLDLGGGHAHCGTLVYLGDNFPLEYRNTVLMCNVHGRRINRDLLVRKGSGYTARHGSDFLVAGDPWFMGVTLRTGPDGGVFVSDWSDTGECHTYQPQRDTGRIYKVRYAPKQTNERGTQARRETGTTSIPHDLAGLSDVELARLHLHTNDWFVRHARRLLHERAASNDFNGQAVQVILRETLHNGTDAPRRLRALWALHVTGLLDEAQLVGLLDDADEHVRAWAIQLLCEAQPPAEALRRFVELAADDPSPVVRLYLASALQRLPIDDRWSIAEGLLAHADDASDQNLPLVDWYGVEPLVASQPERSLRLAVAARVPLVRQFIARRYVDSAIALGERANLDLLATVLSQTSESAQGDLLVGAREALQGHKRVPMPRGWANVYSLLKQSADRAVGQHATMLALVFGDPRAVADLRATAFDAAEPAAERQVALEALIDQGSPDLAPALHDLLADVVLRRTALRGLAALRHAATPEKILARYAELTLEEKQEALATLASRRDFALALLAAVEQKTVPREDISAFVARQLHALGDAQITERLRRIWGEVRETPPSKKAQIARYKELLTSAYLKNADLDSGRQLYAKTCQACHVLYGEGGKIGPDLTGSNRANLDYLLANIVDPSAEIARDYRMSVVETTSGRVITGMITERSANRLTIQTATERIVLAAEDVEDVEVSALSMMPEGQLEQLTKQQVRDLIAYLSTAPH
jgi:putative membrane-bound dehydrogenase-like protein